MTLATSDQNLLFECDREVGKRRIQGGLATTDVLLSAHLGGNADLFPKILELHVADGSVIADVTFGGGVFWRNVPKGKYTLRTTDIADGYGHFLWPYAAARRAQ